MKISTSTDGFTCDMGNDALITLGWEEIESIHFDRVNATTEQFAYGFLVFEFENGDFVEVNTEIDGFPDLLSDVEKRFPMPEDWRDTMKPDDFGESIELWRRNSNQ